MAEAQDTRDWQAGVDAGLVRRLQRPLRRSAAVACAWAREALARAQLGELPRPDLHPERHRLVGVVPLQQLCLLGFQGGQFFFHLVLPV